jgi:hypothetical protein
MIAGQENGQIPLEHVGYARVSTLDKIALPALARKGPARRNRERVCHSMTATAAAAVTAATTTTTVTTAVRATTAVATGGLAVIIPFPTIKADEAIHPPARSAPLSHGPEFVRDHDGDGDAESQENEVGARHVGVR